MAGRSKSDQIFLGKKLGKVIKERLSSPGDGNIGLIYEPVAGHGTQEAEGGHDNLKRAPRTKFQVVRGSRDSELDRSLA